MSHTNTQHSTPYLLYYFNLLNSSTKIQSNMATTARGGAATHRDNLHREVVPFAAMVSLQCINVGLNTLFKVAANAGMSSHVYIVYAYAVAALLLLPAPFFSRRLGVLPSFNSSVMLKVFLLALIGYSAQIIGFTGISDGSPTLSAAIGNLSPAFTFVLAVIFRMEKLVLSSMVTWAKLIGLVVSVLGAFVVTFYKGPSIINAHLSSPLSLYPLLNSTRSDWILGSLLITIANMLAPIWNILMTHIMKEYPSELTITFTYTSSVSVLAAIVGFFAEPDSSKWIVKSNIALACIVCSGILNGCISNVVDTWILHLRGPVYEAMFKPLQIVIAAAMGIIILGDTLSIGSIIGATIIVIGFYTMMWGKAKEELDELLIETINWESSTDQNNPFL